MFSTTNVLIAALVSRGLCHQLVPHCLTNHLVFTSEFILEELTEKLVTKFKHSEESAQEAMSLIRSRTQIVVPNALSLSVCRDADDDWILATAITADAELLISGDNDLLVLERYENIRIVAPRTFADLERLDHEGEQ